MTELKKRLGLLDVFCIASGAMISSGIFVLPGIAYGRAGPGIILSYLLAGLLASTGLLSTAELATAMPKAGSDYFFITRGVGPAVGTVAGLFNWVSFSLKSAFALVGMGAFIQLWAPVDMRVTGVALALGFIALNLVGVKEAARLQLALVGGLLVLMLLYVVWGVPEVNVQRYTPFAPKGAATVFATAGLVFVSYGGLLKIASIAEEIRDPGRTIPTGMILSLVVTSIFYISMVFVTIGVLPPSQLDGSLTPVADGALAFMGPGGQIAFGIAAALAFLTTANAGIMTGSRYLLAMSRDRMLPHAIGRVGARFRTPHVAILVTGALVIVPLFVDLYVLVEAASIGLILTNILANLSVIILRESRLQNYRPKFRSPFYPWVQLAGILGFTFILFEMGVEAFAISALLAVSGFCLYWFYGRARVQRESALLHLVHRVMAKELVSVSLENELRAIIRERDEIVVDRFDTIIEDSIVIDTTESVSAKDLFGMVAERLSDRIDVDQQKLFAALMAREEESSTVISSGLAVPHVVVEGQGVFEVTLARSRSGFVFGADSAPVYSVFVLVGSKDERNFHLQVLSAVAQIVQERDFEKRWLAARGEQGLRDLVLLGERKRH